VGETFTGPAHVGDAATVEQDGSVKVGITREEPRVLFVTAGGDSVVGHLDTLASCSFISATTQQRLGLQVHSTTRRTGYAQKGQGVPTTDMLGEATMKLRLCSGSGRDAVMSKNLYTDVLVVRDLRYDMIVGRDLLAQLGVKLHINTTPAYPTSPTDSHRAEHEGVDETSAHRVCAMDVEVELYQEQDEIREVNMDEGALENLLSTMNSQLATVIRRHRTILRTQLKEDACRVGEHQINLLPGTVPYKRGYYRLSMDEKLFLEKELADLLRLGIIRRSRSPWGSPVVLVKKATGGLRMCVDYRRLNASTIAEVEPLPFLEDIVDRLHGARYFSKLDLKSGFWQVVMREADTEKTAFLTHQGQYEWTRMPFGLRNATATFQKVMRRVLGGLDHCSITHVDDVLIFSKTMEEHVAHVDEILQRLEEANLIVNLTKCEFLKEEIVFVGHTFAAGGMTVVQSKVAAINNIKRPSTATDVRRFLGMTGYYRKFIRNYARIAQPLNTLTKKDSKFTWGCHAEEGFTTLKHALTSAPILVHPDNTRTFIVETDASDLAVGAVLCQDYDGDHKPIAFYSRVLNPAEKNYHTTEKECLAVVEALAHWRHYLIDRPFQLRTDHQALTWLNTLKDYNKRQTRWAIAIQDYTYEVAHISGASNVVPDALSRLDTLSALEVETPVDAQHAPKSPLTAEQYEDALMSYVRSPEHEMPDELSKTVKRRIERDAMFMSVLEDGTVTHKQREVPVKERRSNLVYHAHILGHYGVENTIGKLQRSFWWPGMRDDVSLHVKNCFACAHYADDNTGNMTARTDQITKLYGPWERWSMDFIGPLRTSKRGCRYILTIVDQLTQYVELFATSDKSSATVSRCIMEVISRFGPPRRMMTDQAKEFIHGVMQELELEIGIKQQMTSTYRPRSNGLAEKTNHLIMLVLKKLAHDDQDNWDTYIPYVAMCDRMRVRDGQQHCPMFLLLGREPNLMQPWKLQTPHDDPLSEVEELQLLDTCLKDHLDKMAALLAITYPELMKENAVRREKVREEMRRKKIIPNGTYVLLRKLRSTGDKLTRKYHGLYRVSGYTSNGNYLLETTRGGPLGTPVPPDRTRVIGNDLASKIMARREYVDDVVEDEVLNPDERRVDKIVDHQETARGLLYHVKWTTGVTEWVPQERLQAAQSIDRYWVMKRGADMINDLPFELQWQQPDTDIAAEAHGTLQISPEHTKSPEGDNTPPSPSIHLDLPMQTIVRHDEVATKSISAPTAGKSLQTSSNESQNHAEPTKTTTRNAQTLLPHRANAPQHHATYLTDERQTPYATTGVGTAERLRDENGSLIDRMRRAELWKQALRTPNTSAKHVPSTHVNPGNQVKNTAKHPSNH